MQIKENGKLRLLFEMHDFHGSTMRGLWEDMKFEIKHSMYIYRLAIVLESKCDSVMATFCKPFTSAEIKYFDHSVLDDAREWIAAD